MARRTAVAVLVLAWVCACAGAQDLLPLKHVVVFNNNGRQPPASSVYPLFRLSEVFGMVEDFYTPGTLDATIADNLARARLLYVGQYCDESPLFTDPQLCEAIRALLQRGGAVFFDYGTGSDKMRFRPETVAFLKSVGVTPPDGFHPGYGKSVFAEAKTHALLAAPAPIGGKETGHYGWWEICSPGQIALARDVSDKNKATLVLQEGVEGKGAVLFNQLPSVFRESSGVCFDLVRNVLAAAYAEGRSAQ